MITGGDLAAGARLATTIIACLFVAAACASAATPAPGGSDYPSQGSAEVYDPDLRVIDLGVILDVAEG